MIQPDLFEVRARRDLGISRAIDHAEWDYPGWKEEAGRMLRKFARTIGTSFLSEEFVAYAKAHGLQEPPDGRAFGAVIRCAQRSGLIRKDGYGQAKSSNLSPKCLWRAAK